ncbi:hypothetical protein, conserved [Eimeria necatrix]|uniref:Uncharacterized protein n=1 Tax=Eimeria necatrix TaxID=51315 RepID=U6MSI1_9EIME|nr:hypothetical protein, conserved [Eimeria necatrix]CDJ64605.1 hypothetical protein, conserved [Eimeria necatrix]
MYINADFVKGKVTVKGDGIWVRVDFPSTITDPLVFLGSPDFIGNYGIRAQAEYVVLAQIQNMASVVEDALEFNTTPYVFAKGSVEYRLKRFYISLSSSIMTNAPKVIIGIMALGSALSTNFGTAKISLRARALLTSGEEISHDLGSPVLAFIQPYYSLDSYSYAVEDCDSETHCVPRMISDCHYNTNFDVSLASYLLLAYGQLMHLIVVEYAYCCHIPILLILRETLTNVPTSSRH